MTLLTKTGVGAFETALIRGVSARLVRDSSPASFALALVDVMISVGGEGDELALVFSRVMRSFFLLLVFFCPLVATMGVTPV